MNEARNLIAKIQKAIADGTLTQTDVPHIAEILKNAPEATSQSLEERIVDLKENGMTELFPLIEVLSEIAETNGISEAFFEKADELANHPVRKKLMGMLLEHALQTLDFSSQFPEEIIIGQTYSGNLSDRLSDLLIDLDDLEFSLWIRGHNQHREGFVYFDPEERTLTYDITIPSDLRHKANFTVSVNFTVKKQQTRTYQKKVIVANPQES